MSAQRGSLEGTVRKTRPNELIPEVGPPGAIYPLSGGGQTLPGEDRLSSSWLR